MPFQSAIHVSQLDLSIRGKLIRAEEWQEANSAQEALAVVRKLKESAEQAALLLREQAREQGRQQGVVEGQAAFAANLARLAQQEVDRIRLHEQRVTQIALAVVQRLLGQLSAEQLVGGLVQEAVASAIADQFITIRVSKAAKPEIEKQVQHFRQLHPAVASIEVLADPTLTDGACVVTSEAGEVRGNVLTQFAAIQQALLDASASVA
jgi:flagellar biosynthesis/type III secretory pathway protein FliH